MSYILENTAEAERLKLQDKITAYDLNLDLGDFDIKSFHHVLDAGCGAGIVSLFLKKHFRLEHLDSCDFSDLRMKQAEKYLNDNAFSSSNFYQCDLEEIPKTSETYDRIVCRFVYEYLQKPLEVTKELYRVCKINGRVRLIDLDGVVCNFQTNNSELKKMLVHFIRSHPLTCG
jgi:ubiquinone/menaquinone biosynthesis C-methylase UbiE